MKKTMKILGGSLLVALMSISLATKLNVREVKHLEVRDLLTEDMTKPVTGKVVKRAANEEAANKISAVKAQIADAAEGKRHIRFVVGLDSVNYADAKFNIVAKDGDNVVKTFADQPVTTAYTHIEAAGVVQSAAQVFGADYNYLMAFTIKNVPASAWNYNFEVTSSVKKEAAADWTTSEVATKNISKIAELDKEEIAAPAFDWQGVVEGGERDAYAPANAGKQLTIYKGVGCGHYFNTETKALNIGINGGKNAEWWAVQLFAAPANIAVGNEYEVSFDIYSPVAGKIRVRQQNYEISVGNNTISYKTRYAGGTDVDSAPFSLQFATPESSREEINTMLNVDGDVNPYVISNFMMREVEKEPVVGPEVPEGPYTVEVLSTALAANYYRISWTEDADAITLEPTKADFKVNVGIIAALSVHVLNAEQKFVEFNALTGAEPNRTVTARLHTANGDRLLELRVEGGAYAGYSMTDAECTHIPVEPNPDQPEPEVPTQTAYKVEVVSIEGAGNQYRVRWTDDADAITLAPTMADFKVNVGIVANLTVSVLNPEQKFVEFNAVTGSEPARTVTAKLHTNNGDKEFKFEVVGGEYQGFTVTDVECNHVVADPDTPVEMPEAPAGALGVNVSNWDPHGDGYLHFNFTTDDGLTHADVAEYKVRAIYNGVESDFVFQRIVETNDVFLRNSKIGGAITSANYILVVEIVATNGNVYFAAFNMVNGRPA